MACGKKMDGPTMPYDGLCSGPDDPGNSTECDEKEFKSCMTGVISESKIIYLLIQTKSLWWFSVGRFDYNGA